MARLGSGLSSDKIVSGSVSVGNRLSFSFHYINAAVPPAANRQSLSVGVGSTEVINFAYGHTNSVYRQAVTIRTSSGSFYPAKLTTSLAANTYYIIGGRWDGTALTAWLDGVLEATNSSASNPSTGTGAIGLLHNVATSTSYDTGAISFACVWNVALSDGEMAALGRGIHPTLIRPLSILGGSDCGRAVTGYNSVGWTVTGTTVVDNGRLIPPQRRRGVYVPAAAASGRVFALAGLGGGLVYKARGLAA